MLLELLPLLLTFHLSLDTFLPPVQQQVQLLSHKHSHMVLL